MSTPKPELSVFWVGIEKIDPNPQQPRREFRDGSLIGLSQSIRQYGILQPLIVTKKESVNDEGNISIRYELIAGERRLRAAKLAGLLEVPVVIRNDIEEDQARLELAIIENLQREDLNPIDRARAFKILIAEHNMTHSEVAKRMGRSREYISNSLRLLSLPSDMIDAVVSRQISEGHTRPLLMLNDRPEEQRTLFEEIINRRITVRDAETIARRHAVEKVRKSTSRDPKFEEIAQTIEQVLNTRVQIQKQGDSGGKIVIDFFNDEDLNHIVEKLYNERKEDTPENTDKKSDSYFDEDDMYNVDNFSL